MDILEYYVTRFNSEDEEIYKNEIDNSHALEWMRREVPIFECPDKDIEGAYYFRFWTYRKHIKSTPEGRLITEFLPDVPWSGEYNTINAASAHHIYEGRWLRHSSRYLKNYFDFIFDRSEKSHKYSTWVIDAAYKYACLTQDFDFGRGFLQKLCRYYELWEFLHGTESGAFYSYDNYDAMEYSVSGTDEDLVSTPGVRPTLNSYMCADAYAISRFAALMGEDELSEKYLKKHEELKRLINEVLYYNGFYRPLHRRRISTLDGELSTKRNRAPRELIGYIPWMFDIPELGKEDCFLLLTDENYFYGKHGLYTVERNCPRFLYPVNHDCLWNGYVWPFATSQTLTALNRAAMRSGREDLKRMFIKLLKQYAASHTRVREDGKQVFWIDEVMHPESGVWAARELLKSRGWQKEIGGYERGKDYNHSSFCDLVISGIVGIEAFEDGRFTVTPNIPEDWSYMRLSGVVIGGLPYDIVYDRDGTKYGEHKGLYTVTCNGRIRPIDD